MIQKIKRSQITKADYNPRVMSDEKRGKLEQSLAKYGMVGVYVWNKLTGNLVAGHQRLSIEDEKHPGGEDWELEADVVDLSLEDEKALNMILNSAEVSGEFDKGAVKRLLGELGGKLDFDLESLVVGAPAKGKTKLTKKDALKPPKMAWALVGIPVTRIGEIQAQLDLIAVNPDTILETTFN